jgi:hypothetical protein
VWLAVPDTRLSVVPARALTRQGSGPLTTRCADADLLVVPSSPAAQAVARRLPIPVLFAQWCRDGRDVTDEILVAVTDGPGASDAAQLAAQLAVRHRGAVSVVAAPMPSRDLLRALAASSRIILSTAGTTPRLLGELPSPERSVSRAAEEIGASLLVIGPGTGAETRRIATEIARFSSCSVLMVPAPSYRGLRFSRPATDRVPAVVHAS